VVRPLFFSINSELAFSTFAVEDSTAPFTLANDDHITIFNFLVL
jgi:hypothetical protein